MATDYKAKAAELKTAAQEAITKSNERAETFKTARANAKTKKGEFKAQRAEVGRISNAFKANHATHNQKIGPCVETEALLANADKNGAGEEQKKQLQANLSAQSKQVDAVTAKQSALVNGYQGSQIPSSVTSAEIIKAI